MGTNKPKEMTRQQAQALRESLGLSRETVEDDTGIGRQTILRYEHGTHNTLPIHVRTYQNYLLRKQAERTSQQPVA